VSERIMFDSDEAAQPWTQEGWKSRDGYFYADERAARYSGCTHRPCEDCGAPTAKMYVYCESCCDKRDVARYAAMPEARWDGKQMIYSETLERFFSDPEEAEDWLDEEGRDIVSLRLVLCEPCHIRPLDIDYLYDDLPEDGEAPDAVLEAMDAFNAATKDIILSWYPGKMRLAVTP